jgi:hypothetical protein
LIVGIQDLNKNQQQIKFKYPNLIRDTSQKILIFQKYIYREAMIQSQNFETSPSPLLLNGKQNVIIYFSIWYLLRFEKVSKDIQLFIICIQPCLIFFEKKKMGV